TLNSEIDIIGTGFDNSALLFQPITQLGQIVTALHHHGNLRGAVHAIVLLQLERKKNAGSKEADKIEYRQKSQANTALVTQGVDHFLTPNHPKRFKHWQPPLLSGK